MRKGRTSETALRKVFHRQAIATQKSIRAITEIEAVRHMRHRKRCKTNHLSRLSENLLQLGECSSGAPLLDFSYALSSRFASTLLPFVRVIASIRHKQV